MFKSTSYLMQNTFWQPQKKFYIESRVCKLIKNQPNLLDKIVTLKHFGNKLINCFMQVIWMCRLTISCKYSHYVKSGHLNTGNIQKPGLKFTSLYYHSFLYQQFFIGKLPVKGIDESVFKYVFKVRFC